MRQSQFYCRHCVISIECHILTIIRKTLISTMDAEPNEKKNEIYSNSITSDRVLCNGLVNGNNIYIFKEKKAKKTESEAIFQQTQAFRLISFSCANIHKHMHKLASIHSIPMADHFERLTFYGKKSNKFTNKLMFNKRNE